MHIPLYIYKTENFDILLTRFTLEVYSIYLRMWIRCFWWRGTCSLSIVRIFRLLNRFPWRWRRWVVWTFAGTFRKKYIVNLSVNSTYISYNFGIKSNCNFKIPLMFAELLAPLFWAVFLLLALCKFFDWFELCCGAVLAFLLISWCAFPLLVILMLTALSSPLLIYAVVLYWFAPEDDEGGLTFRCFGGLFRRWGGLEDPPPLFLAFLEVYLVVLSYSSSASSYSTSPLLPDVEFDEVRHWNIK